MKNLRNIIGSFILLVTLGFLVLQGLVYAQGNNNNNNNNGSTPLYQPTIHKKGWHESKK
jgi:hypothetical protein